MLLSCKSPPVTVVLGIRPSSTRNLGFPCCNSFVLFLSNIHLCCFPSVCSLHQHSFLSPGESANGSISQARPDRCPFPGGEARGGGGGGGGGGAAGVGEKSPSGEESSHFRGWEVGHQSEGLGPPALPAPWPSHPATNVLGQDCPGSGRTALGAPPLQAFCFHTGGISS